MLYQILRCNTRKDIKRAFRIYAPAIRSTSMLGIG